MNRIGLALVGLLMAGCSSDDQGKGVFELLSAGRTGVEFVNHIEEGLNTNVLMYEYFYNGGGVAAGDLNNDGWEDLYFTSNMEDNHLYLNKGEMKFNEVAAVAGVQGRPGPWKTGVSLVDVNADGMLDIYLCYSGNLPDDKKRNQLFINLGNKADGTPVFKDEAAAYGLDHPGNSTHAVFFDYDKDQDLDMILVNHNPKSLPVLDESSTADMLSREDENSGLVFFENPGSGKPFVKKTKELGIRSSSLSYGLSVAVSDFNGDGWLDFYVSNDYTIPDYLYINQSGQGFKNVIDESLGHFSHFSMGNDVADVNNDLRTDILTLDMLPEDNKRQKLLMAPDNYEKFEFNERVGFGKQYMRNMLQLNRGVDRETGNPIFAEVGQQFGISNTDWSWSALFADYDNDGWKDLYVTNGYLRDYTNLDFLKYMGDYVQNNQQNIQRDNVLEMVKQMPASDLTNYMFNNDKGQGFTNNTKNWGLDKSSNSNGATYADLDRDGDLDLVVNNINVPAFVFENKTRQQSPGNHFLSIQLKGSGENTFGIGASVRLYASGQTQLLEQQPFRSYQSSVSPILHAGTGAAALLDSVVVLWNTGVSQTMKNVKTDQLLTFKEEDAVDVFNQPETALPWFEKKNQPIVTFKPIPYNDFKRQTQLVTPMSFFGPALAKGDLNGDGREDLMIGASAGDPVRVLVQSNAGSFVPMAAALQSQPSHAETGAILLHDLDADGDLDAYLAAGGYGNIDVNDNTFADQVYFNDGKGRFSPAPALPALAKASRSCVVSIDLGDDALPDLFIGSRVIPGAYPLIPSSSVLRNLGGGKFEDVSARYPLVTTSGMVSDAKWADLNADKKPELILAGHWMPIRVFSLSAKGEAELTANFFDQAPSGFWNSIQLADLNDDGKPEIIAGNLGLNSQLKASLQQPVEMIAKDFDNNGAIDPILTSYVMGKQWPFMTRDELLDQLTMMRSRFTSYAAYAEAPLEKVFTSDELQDALKLQATELRTEILAQSDKGKFEPIRLPGVVQNAPIFCSDVLDVNGDGKQDLILAGNITHARLRLGNMDANDGLLLLGDGKLNFIPQEQDKTGLWFRGDIRQIFHVGQKLYAAKNSNGLFEYQFKRK